jgi:CheY-like chemotaxis protein
MRVLIFDDQPGLAELLAASDGLCGHRLHSSGRSFGGDSGKGCIIVTDYHMPEMTGLEVARRAYEQGWRGALFIMSGQASTIKEPLDHPLLLLVLNKPFFTRELVDILPSTRKIVA